MKGICRICGCTNETPCAVDADYSPSGRCQWMDEGHTLCSNPRCVAQIPMDDLLDIFFPRYAHQVQR